MIDENKTKEQLMPAVAGDGSVTGFIGLVSDVTEQRRAEDALRLTEAVADSLAEFERSFSVLQQQFALLRQSRLLPVTVLRFADLELDRVERTVTRNGTALSLTLIEFKLLEVLMVSAGEVTSGEEVRRAVWGMDFDRRTATLRVHMSNLRAKLEAGGGGCLIATVPGRGYKMIDPTEPSELSARR